MYKETNQIGWNEKIRKCGEIRTVKIKKIKDIIKNKEDKNKKKKQKEVT